MVTRSFELLLSRKLQSVGFAGAILLLSHLNVFAATVATPTYSPAAGTFSNAQSVTISTTTSGASIRYTTDGSTPSSTVGTVYSAPVNVSVTTTLKAIGYKSGSTNSAVTSGTYTMTVAAPTFTPVAGTYTSVQTVTIASTTSGASIRYTTDGSTPSATVGTVYSAPVGIGATTTLKAIAYKTGSTTSTVTSGVYTINLPVVATPTFNPVAGTYTSIQSVTIATSTSGAAIRYTTDGSTPSSTVGTLYSAPVSISATKTLKAIAYKSGSTNSSVASGTYTINLPVVATPTFSPAAGTYTSTQSVTISTTTSGASIRYTTDGSIPTATAGTVYSGPVSIGATSTLKAIAYKSGSIDSSVTSGLYTINLPVVATPTFSPVAGTYTSAQTVTIATTTSGASIRYTTDGSTPSATVGTVYSAPVSIGSTTTLKAIGYNIGSTNSSVASGTYTINLPVAAPVCSPVAGTYTSAQTVAITTSTSGASIRYTKDGSTPSATVGTVYSAPISIGATTTIKAIGYKTGVTSSPVTTSAYTINLTVNSPIFSPAPGSYTGTQTVTITSSTSGASIRYTTDGSTPTLTVGTVYSSPVMIGTTATLKAIAYKSGSTNSSITSGIYTISLPTLPYVTDFEAGQGYILSSLAGQLGWTVGPGAAVVTTADFSDGIQSVQLSPNNPATVIGQSFASSAGVSVDFFDFYAKPVAGSSPGIASTFTVDEAEFSFKYSGNAGTLHAYRGNGSGGGTWAATRFTAPLAANHKALNWVRLTARLDFSTQKWDLYANTQMVAADIPFIGASTYLSNFELQGDITTASNLDDIFAGPANPLFADVNNNGIDDGWETSHGLSLSNNNRNLSPTGNGVTVVQAYAAGTNPNDFYNSAAPTLTIVSGNNQTTVPGQFNAQPFIVSVKNAAGTAPLSNAPVTFNVMSGDGFLATTNVSGATLTSISLNTAADGNVAVYYKHPTGYNVTSQIQLIAGAGQILLQTKTAIAVANPGNDDDGDGLTNIQESAAGTSPTNRDSDSDGFEDGFEVSVASNPSLADSDTVLVNTGGLRLLLRADDSTTAGAMAAWSDRSGKNIQTTQTVVAARPSRVLNALNGRAVVRFSGANFFNVKDALKNATAAEAFIVTSSNVGASRGLWNFGTNSQNNRYPDADGTIYENFGTNANYNIGSSLVPLSVPHLYNISAQSTDWTVRQNGLILNASGSQSIQFRSSAVLGLSAPNGAAYYSGDVAEMIFFDRVLTSAARENVAGYLSRKYGLLPLPAAPTGLLAHSATTGATVLSWVTQPGLGAVSYDVERKIGAGEFMRIGASDIPAYQDTTVLSGESYTYRVKTRNYNGTSVYSDEINITSSISGVIPLAGLKLWLDAESLNAGSVNIWPDLSGQGNHLTQTVLSRQPTKTIDNVSGFPVVRFDGIRSSLKFQGNVLADATAGDMFIVTKSVSAPARQQALMTGYYPSYYGNITENFGYTATNMGPPVVPLNTYHIYNVTSDVADSIGRQNGVLLYKGHHWWASFGFALQNLGSTADSNYYAGDVCEIVVYDRVLTEAERSSVFSHLNSKYPLNSTGLLALPSTPSELAAVASSDRHVYLTWNHVAGVYVETVEVERRILTGTEWLPVGNALGTASFKDSSVPEGSHEYRVRTRNVSGASEYSLPVSISVADGVVAGLPSTGLALWLRADSGITEPRVSTWGDSAGTGVQAVQAASVNQPVVIDSAINGYPAVHFDGDDFLTLGNFMATKMAGEIFVVAQASDLDSSAYRPDRGLWKWGTAAELPIFYRSNLQVTDDFGSDRIWSSNGGGFADWSQANLYNISADADSWVMRANGDERTHEGGSNVAFSAQPILGMASMGTSLGFLGNIAEILVFERVLTPTERTSVQTYLTRKYALLQNTRPPIPGPITPTLNGGDLYFRWPKHNTNEFLVYEVEKRIGAGPFIKVDEESENFGYPYYDYIDYYLDSNIYSYRIRARDRSNRVSAYGPVLRINVTDTDNDGMSNSWEVANGLNPNFNDSLGDADGDGLINWREHYTGANPNQGDTDGDGLSDSAEDTGGTNPANQDSDRDGLSDGYEREHGFDPNDPNSGGQPPPAGTLPQIKFTLGDSSGSYSEKYDMEIRGFGGDSSVYHFVNSQFGVLENKTFTLNTDASYKIKITWVASNQPTPDRDYTAKIGDVIHNKSLGDHAFTVSDGSGKLWFVCLDEDDIFGTHNEPSAASPFHAKDKEALLLPVPKLLKLYDKYNKANQVYNPTPKDDPWSSVTESGNGAPRNMVFVVAENAQDTYKIVAEFSPPATTGSKFLVAAYNGTTKIYNSDSVIGADGKCELTIKHTGFYDIGDFTVRLAYDQNGNGTVETFEVIKLDINGYGEPTVKGINDSEYRGSKSMIDATVDGSILTGSDFFFPHARQFLRLFRDGNVAIDFDQNKKPSDISSKTLEAFGGYLSEWLTHNSGASFSDSGIANIPFYTWNTATSSADMVATAPQIEVPLRKFFNNVITPLIIADSQNWPLDEVRYYPSASGFLDVPRSDPDPNESPSWVEKPTVTFDGVPMFPDDVSGTIGRGRLLSQQAQYAVRKQETVVVDAEGATSTIVEHKVIQVISRGSVEDLYDFSATFAGTAGSNRSAAIVQLGYGKGLLGQHRNYGKIYIHNINFRKTYTYLP